MQKSEIATRQAFEKGYRVDDSGAVISPSGRNRKLQTKKCRHTEYYYFNVSLNGKSFPVRVHRLAAYQKYGSLIFASGMQVRHLNNDSFDNSRENISIGPATDNRMDEPKEKRTQRAKHAGLANSRKDWDVIDAARRRGMSYRDIENAYGVPRSSLSYRYSQNRAATVKRGAGADSVKLSLPALPAATSIAKGDKDDR